MSSPKNILFDLGNVILDLNTTLMLERMERLLGIPYDVYNETMPDCFHEFERGDITEDQFVMALKKVTNKNFDLHAFRLAWNSILLNIPKSRIELLVKLKLNYNLFLISNTNETHLSALGNETLEILELIFNHCYYSCRIGRRKPDREAFEFVMQDAGILPEETIFIDDGWMHVEGARKLGIKSYLHNPHHDLSYLIKELELLQDL
jgi:glucose-1-phosphatase